MNVSTFMVIMINVQMPNRHLIIVLVKWGILYRRQVYQWVLKFTLHCVYTLYNLNYNRIPNFNNIKNTTNTHTQIY